MELKVNRMMDFGVMKEVMASRHPQWKDDHYTVSHLSGLWQIALVYIFPPSGEYTDASENHL